MYKLELSWTKSEQEEILKVLRSRSKVYLGLETSGGLQLQLRLESLAIELILQAYVWDYELYERALHFSKIHFKKGILLTCLLRGNQIFPLSNRLSSWYEAPLELTYRLAQYLSGSAEKAPSQRLLKQLEEGATFYFEYYRDQQEVFLSFQVLPEKVSLLCEGLSPEEQSLLKDQIGQGLEMKGVVYGELITADIAWITLGQEILCLKSNL
jgi:hypothetical protein